MDLISAAFGAVVFAGLLVVAVLLGVALGLDDASDDATRHLHRGGDE